MNFSLTINLGEGTLALLTRLCDSLDGLVEATNDVRGRQSVSAPNEVAAAVADNPAEPISAAQAFGAIPGTQDGVVGNGAPSGVAATPSPIAPVVPQGGAQMPLPGAQLPAASGPSPAPAPMAPAAGGSPAGGVETDTDGLPWDARIHGSTKTKNADGRWRAKKGLNDAALVERVKAELRALMGVQPGAQAPAAAPPAGPSAADVFGAASGNAGGTPPAPSGSGPAAGATAQGTVTTQNTGAAPAQGPGAPTADPTTLAELMLRLTPHNIPPTAVLEACKTWQLPSVPSLNQRPDLVPYVFATLKEQYPNL